MRVMVSYITFQGASGLVGVELEELPKWLASYPGRMICQLHPDSTTIDEQNDFRNHEVQGIKEFAYGLLRSV